MQGNGKISFEIEGVKHSLYFGMTATEIIANSSVTAISKGEVTDIKAFAYILFGGMCNFADCIDEVRPKFQDAYFLAEQIANENEITADIYKAWNESKPKEELLKRLNAVKKKAEQKKA